MVQKKPINEICTWQKGIKIAKNQRQFKEIKLEKGKINHSKNKMENRNRKRNKKNPNIISSDRLREECPTITKFIIHLWW